MPGTRRITPVFRGKTPQGPLRDNEGNDLVDWIKGLGEAYQNMWRGAASTANKYGVNLPGMPTPTPPPPTRGLNQSESNANKAMYDYATASMKFGKPDDPRRGRKFKKP